LPEPVVRSGYATSTTSNTPQRPSQRPSQETSFSERSHAEHPPEGRWSIQSGIPWIFTTYNKGNPGPEQVEDRPSPRFYPGGPWRALTDEISRLPRGTLAEVVLDDSQDPAPLIDAIGSGDGTLGLCAYAARDGQNPTIPDTWYSVRERLGLYPVTGPVDTLAVVVDVSVYEAVLEAVLEGVKNDKVVIPGYGPLAPWWRPEWGTMPLMVRANAAWWWERFEYTRTACEAHGSKIIYITVDARTSWGRGSLEKSHFFRDHRVRSWIGDAGRYWCHQRYRVEPDGLGRPCRVVAIKDEVEGLVGRLVYDNGKQVI